MPLELALKISPHSVEPKVLILTSPAEIHSFAVKEGLARKGVEAVLWHTPDFPTLQAGSVWLDSDRTDWEIIGPELDLRSASIKSLWVRRPTSDWYSGAST